APVQLRFEWGSSKAMFHNEVGVYVLDDASGRVAGLLPSDPGYAEAALSRGQVVFASGAGQGARKTMTFQPGQFVGLYLVSNGTTGEALAGQRYVFFTFDEANADRFDHAQTRVRGDGGRDYRFEDTFGGGDRDFNDAVVGVTRTQALLTPGQAGQT